ncbi:MAG: leucine-rich repeat domain-containing protein [bacterium]|nr:leucine-rich repeat domain-containing protein [bacterium]MDY4108274.1 leucine-rich repeat domain-containing protein [Bacilli bacterium]
MKKKRGFTLVELLAVIVILAVILIIAMPKISDVIKNSKESSLETTAKLIASQAEKKYTENQVLDNSSTIKCSDVAKISDADYESCNITFDSKGNAKVSIVGKGKFEGMAVCNANKNSATVSSDCSADAKYFSYEEVEGGISITGYQIGTVSNVEVKDENKCKSYLQTLGGTEEQATTLCTTNQAVNGLTLQQAVSKGRIPSSDYETAGLKVTYENGGGTDVVIPSQIDGKTVVAIADYAFTTFGVIPTLTAYNNDYNDYKVSLLSYNSNNNYVVKPLASPDVEGLGITSVIIPNTITSIGARAFAYNKLTNVEIPSSVAEIGNYAFAYNKLTNVTIPSSVTLIARYAFAYNKITSITFPDTLITLGCNVFYGNPIMEDSTYSFPSNVTVEEC